MSNPFKESVAKEVLYPDDLAEVGTLELVSEKPYESEEVDIDAAQFGQWIKVENGTHGRVWAAAPRSLREALGEVEAEPGHVFQVRSVSKGPKDHDPYEIKVAHDPEQH